jgi:hypothetical protein
MWIRQSISGPAILVGLLVVVAVGASAQQSATPTPTRKPTPIVIDNETLKKYADEGRITTVQTPRAGQTSQSFRSSSPPGQTYGGVPGGEDAREAEKRRYWRALYEKQLKLVRTLEQQIEVLNREIPGLWRDFYARDDPAYRDGVIKPKLDEALSRWERMTEQLENERAKLPKIREDARREGAKPGWFRGLDSPQTQAGKDDGAKDGTRLPTEFDVDVVTADDTS